MIDFSKVFNVIIRLVFIVAFGAFLLASLRHVAVFFHDFEPDPTGQDWAGSYALAWSIDGTALILTIGMMFFGKSMPWYAKTIVWLFIIGLTGFSWVVNWEYAKAFQSTELTSHLDPIWQSINPILASSFAFLNLAYSIVSEFFGAKPKTVEELESELAELTGTKAELARQIREAKGPSIVQRLKETAKEVKSAAKEVLDNDQQKRTEVQTEPTAEVNEEPFAEISSSERLRETDPEMEAITNDSAEENGSSTTENAEVPHTSTTRFNRRKPMTVMEVADVLGCTERHVRNLRSQMVLLPDEGNKNLITAASVKAYMEKKSQKSKVS